MKSLICTSILLALSGAFLILHEMLNQTWQPMFLMILASFGVSLILAYAMFLVRDKLLRSLPSQIVSSVVIVFFYVVALNICWACSEELMIDHYISSFGLDDTGGRYFYPSNSGMGYAEGLSSPGGLALDVSKWAAIWGVVIGFPLGFISRFLSANKVVDGNQI